MTTSSRNGENFGEYISQAEVARIVGVTKQAISYLVRRGYFTTKAAAGHILILRSEAEAFVPRPKGRPTKDASAKEVPKKEPLEILNRGTSKEYISQAEAARIRGVSQQAIADLIRRGKLTAVTVGGRTLVLRSEIENFVAQPKLGRPPKEKTQNEPSKRAMLKK